MEADFASPVLTARVTVRAIDFNKPKQEKLVEMILANTNALLGAMDRVNDFENSQLLEQALAIVEKMVKEQQRTAIGIIAGKMAEIDHATSTK